MTQRRVVVVNPNTNPDTTARLVAGIAEVLDPRVWTVAGATARQGPPMIIDPDALEASAREVTAAVEEQMAAGLPVDAVIVGAIGDPGREELRERLNFPVVGIGESSVREASAHGPVAIVTSTPLLAPSLTELFAAAVPDGRLIGVFLTDSDPLDLAADPARQAEELAGTARRAVAAGAAAVVIGGAPLNDALQAISRALPGTPVIAPIPAAGRALAALNV